MHRALVVSAFLLVGCVPTVTRTVVVPRDVAETYGARADVEAVIHDGVEREAHDLDEAAPRDQVRARVAFKPGEEVPGEGVVRTRASTSLLVAGAVVIGLGATSAAFIEACPKTSGPPDAFGPPAAAWCATGLAVLSGVLGFAGLVLIGQGVAADAYLDTKPQPKVAITPSVAHDRAGLSMTLRF